MDEEEWKGSNTPLLASAMCSKGKALRDSGSAP
jgi:hypothetical protein